MADQNNIELMNKVENLARLQAMNDNEKTKMIENT